MYQKTVLDNGLRILTSAMPHTRSVSIGFFIGVGSRYESDEQGGVSHFIEHMLFKGTEKRPTARDIAVAMRESGGFLTQAPASNRAATGSKSPNPIWMSPLMCWWTCSAIPGSIRKRLIGSVA